MAEQLGLFSKLDERYGLPTAIIAFAGIVAFLSAVPKGLHIRNQAMMVAGTLFSLSCALYCWHRRDQSSAVYTDEQQTLSSRLRQLPLGSYLACLSLLLVTAFFAYLAWTHPT